MNDFLSGINKIKNSVSARLKTDRAFGYPRRILIEPTNACNLKCPLCPTGIGELGRSTGVMHFKQFKQIIDEIRLYTREVEIAGYGEPFVNKDIYKMLSYAADHIHRVLVHSNCLLIDSQEKVDSLVKSGIHKLTVSIDGATQDVYEKYRVNGDLSLALNNIRRIIATKKSFLLTSPIIEWQVVATKHNETQIDQMRAISESLEVDAFFVKTVNINLISSVRGVKGTPRRFGDLFLPDKSTLRRFGSREGKVLRNACSFLYRNAFVMWNGDVTTCCHDPAGLNKMGNMFETGSLYDVWNNSKYRQLRRVVNVDINSATPLCYVCPDRGVEFVE